jgi:hypothetical protein
MRNQLVLVIFLFFFFGKLFSQSDCAAPTTGLLPINDLGTGISPITGLMGGLYPNGSNFLPEAHKNAGLKMAGEVQCLDASGIPDPVNGKIVWLSIGMSNTTQESRKFIEQANVFPGKNPNLVLVDGALGGHTAQVISNPATSGYSNYWNNVAAKLSTAGVTANQVQVIWLKQANQAGGIPVQQYHDNLVEQLKLIVNELKTRFPNVKLCYMGSRISARYALGALNPEPYAYWQGWAVKKVIEDQINGDEQLIFSGSGANSPWIGWGVYMWSDGSTPQITNPSVFFTCPADFASDGTHPSVAGAEKVGSLLLDFFSNDSTALPWFLGTGCPGVSGVEKLEYKNSLKIFPNPSDREVTIDLADVSGRTIIDVYNPYAERIHSSLNEFQQNVIIDISTFRTGIYLVRVTTDSQEVYFNKLIVAR